MLDNKSFDGMSFVDLEDSLRPRRKLYSFLVNWRVPYFGSFNFCGRNSVNLEPFTAHKNCGNGSVDSRISG